MQGVHRVIKSFSLFDVVSGYMKQLSCPQCKRSACAMRSGSLVLSPSKSAALYKSLHALLFRDIDLLVFIIHPVSLSKQGPKASRIARQSLNAMTPVIPTGKRLVFTAAVEFGTSFIDNQGASAVD
jgi:hypothetical protein